MAKPTPKPRRKRWMSPQTRALVAGVVYACSIFVVATLLWISGGCGAPCTYQDALYSTTLTYLLIGPTVNITNGYGQAVVVASAAAGVATLGAVAGTMLWLLQRWFGTGSQVPPLDLAGGAALVDHPGTKGGDDPNVGRGPPENDPPAQAGGGDTGGHE